MEENNMQSPKKVICCKLKDTEKLMASQSGGAFTAIATAFLKCGGIVYGCEMDYNALRERNGDNNPAHIVIGKDTRRSSYMFEYSLVAGLMASGADACLLHVTTTPSVAYIARVDDFDCGIMISASHNPYYDNGMARKASRPSTSIL